MSCLENRAKTLFARMFVVAAIAATSIAGNIRNDERRKLEKRRRSEIRIMKEASFPGAFVEQVGKNEDASPALVVPPKSISYKTPSDVIMQCVRYVRSLSQGIFQWSLQ